MGKAFKTSKKVVKEIDVDLVSALLSTAVFAIIKAKPEYGDQLSATFTYLSRLVGDENLTEDEFHQEIEKAVSDIGVKDPQVRELVGYFLKKLDKLADKYLDVESGFTEKEREAWAKLFEELAQTAKVARKTAKGENE